MQSLIEMPTTQELASLSVNDLAVLKDQLMDRIYVCLANQERTSELRTLYKIYQDEWLERLKIGANKYRYLSKS